jgi:hypothetical protein
MEPLPRGEGPITADWPGVPGPDQDPNAPRRTYTPPHLRTLGNAADLLEVLGPAQANYGGFP